MAAVLFFLMLPVPESPRWHLLQANATTNDGTIPDDDDARDERRRHYEQAFDIFRMLRRLDLQAAGDLFYLDRMIHEERRRLADVYPKRQQTQLTKWDAFKDSCNASVQKSRKFVTNQKCRRAMSAVLIVMVWQQLCGINGEVRVYETTRNKEAYTTSLGVLLKFGLLRQGHSHWLPAS